MKKYIIIIGIIFATFAYGRLNESIIFIKGNWNDALVTAIKENKPIFIYCYAKWCSPCIWMKMNVFNNDTVAGYYNSHFVCYSCDMETTEGITLKKLFNIQGYPTFLFLNPDGKPLHQICKSMKTDEFIQLAKDVSDTTKCFYFLKYRYENGERDVDLLYNYSIALRNITSTKNWIEKYKYDTIATEYFNTQSKEQLLNEKNWFFITQIIHSIDDSIFVYLNQHKSEFIKRYDSISVYKVIYKIAINSYINVSPYFDKNIHYRANEILSNCKDSTWINQKVFYDQMYNDSQDAIRDQNKE